MPAAVHSPAILYLFFCVWFGYVFLWGGMDGVMACGVCVWGGDSWPPWPWRVPGRTSHQVGWSRGTRGSHATWLALGGSWVQPGRWARPTDWKAVLHHSQCVTARPPHAGAAALAALVFFLPQSQANDQATDGWWGLGMCANKITRTYGWTGHDISTKKR
jgi:hypothetical protein